MVGGVKCIPLKTYCAELQDDAQLVMMDHRGCGRSKRGDPQTYTLENNIADIEALRDYLGLDKIIVYGHSYGGLIFLWVEFPAACRDHMKDERIYTQKPQRDGTALPFGISSKVPSVDI